jgi:5-methylcytosine-specific restriction endonuclease McrA
MAFRDDHQHLEADRLLLGQRAAKALQKENRTALADWTVAKLRRKRARAIVLRAQSGNMAPTPLSKTQRRRLNRIRALAARDGLECYYCRLKFVTEDDPAITFDHVISKSEGGTDALENQVLSCAPCNEKKGGIHGKSPRYLVGLPSRSGSSAWRAS